MELDEIMELQRQEKLWRELAKLSKEDAESTANAGQEQFFLGRASAFESCANALERGFPSAFGAKGESARGVASKVTQTRFL